VERRLRQIAVSNWFFAPFFVGGGSKMNLLRLTRLTGGGLISMGTLEPVHNISPVILEKQCIGCHKPFQTFDINKVWCGARCQRDHVGMIKHKQGEDGRFVKYH